MHIVVNNEAIELEQEMNIAQFIDWFKQTGNFAVAVNMEFIPRSLYAETVLKDKDKIEIVQPMQGG